MPDNAKRSKADAQRRGEYLRAVAEHRRQREAQDAALRQRLSASRPAKTAPAPNSGAIRTHPRAIGRERVLADDGSLVVVQTTAPTVLRLAHHRQKAAMAFCRDFEIGLGGLRSANLEFRPRSTSGDFGHARRIEAAARIREVRQHVVGGGFCIMVAMLVCGVAAGEIAGAAKVATAQVHRELNDALDRASNIYAPGRGGSPKWARRAYALAEHHIGNVAWLAE